MAANRGVNAEEVAEYAFAMSEALAELARRTGLLALAWRLEETRRTARAAPESPSSVNAAATALAGALSSLARSLTYTGVGESSSATRAR